MKCQRGKRRGGGGGGGEGGEERKGRKREEVYVHTYVAILFKQIYVYVAYCPSFWGHLEALPQPVAPTTFVRRSLASFPGSRGRGLGTRLDVIFSTPSRFSH